MTYQELPLLLEVDYFPTTTHPEVFYSSGTTAVFQGRI